jgi:probable HAF family extracellular repeat protein
MSRHLSPSKLAFTLSLLVLGACDQSPIPSGPPEPASSTAATAVSYTARDLGIAGEFATTATSINAAGQVVGYWFRPDDVFRGFIWKNGITTYLTTLGGSETRAMDINDFGQVVGSSVNLQGKWRASRWRNGVKSGLGSLGGTESRAFAINNKNDVVGESQLRGSVISHAFLVKNGVMTDLGTLGGANSAALDINDAGQIVGWSETSNGTRHPFLWQNGVMRDLLPPGSAITGTAYAINSAGVAVGEKNHHAFRYYNGVMANLGMLGSGPSVALGIRGGRIVGTAFGRGFLLFGGEVTLLPLPPGASSAAAHAVNGAGVIVGNSDHESVGSQSVTMWTLE